MESMVQITKKVLKSIFEDRQFTDDSMYTFLTEVESVVSSRPLTSVSDTIDDSEALTANYFLIGRRSNNFNIISDQAVDITSKRK